MQSVTNLAGRILMVAIFLWGGLGKISGYAGFEQYMRHLGLAVWLTPFVILLELGGGLAVLLGFYTRVMALALACFCVATAGLVHYHPQDPMQMINFMKNLSMTGGFLILAAYGAGKLSLDERLKLRLR
ncbi:MAG: DoxX family protein [Gammaproteobacteria bacterium]|nr:DoxX family protein [Gammaproteobacteria bacterium]